MKVYYHTDTALTIYDKKNRSEASLREQFGIPSGELQTVTLAAGEEDEVVGGVLSKYVISVRGSTKAQREQTAIDGKVTAIKAKLGLTDEDLENLKVALN